MALRKGWRGTSGPFGLLIPSHAEQPTVTLNLFQGPFIRSSYGRAARWTLKRVQGDVGDERDVVEMAGRRRTTAALSNLQRGLFDAFCLFTAAAGEPDRDEGKLV
jgi:hypothetical protein